MKQYIAEYAVKNASLQACLEGKDTHSMSISAYNYSHAEMKAKDFGATYGYKFLIVKEVKENN